MIFTEGQCDYETTVSSAMKLLGCDEKQERGKILNLNRFCKNPTFSQPHLPLRKPRCHVNKEKKEEG